jgi:phosphopantothenoylcysteine decarboxylase/phosphopantothenate--cysteine ligase
MAKDATKLGGVNILLGISGGVAAYKAVEFASKLTAAGAHVKCVMTENACRLVGPKSLEAVTGSVVYTSLWESPEAYSVGHVSLAEWADIVVLAPATANIIGKIASGICDDLLSTVFCACWSKPVLAAPAMNNNMWENPAVRHNVSLLRDRGFEFAGPKAGRLACGSEAIGRMAEPQEILEAVEKIAYRIKRKKG